MPVQVRVSKSFITETEPSHASKSLSSQARVLPLRRLGGGDGDMGAGEGQGLAAARAGQQQQQLRHRQAAALIKWAPSGGGGGCVDRRCGHALRGIVVRLRLIRRLANPSLGKAERFPVHNSVMECKCATSFISFWSCGHRPTGTRFLTRNMSSRLKICQMFAVIAPQRHAFNERSITKFLGRQCLL